MAKEIRCGEIVVGCEFRAEGATEEEIVKKVAEHAAAAHGVKTVTPELAAQVKAAIRTT